MGLIENVLSSTSVLPLLSQIRKLDEAPVPAALVDVAFRHKVITPLQVRGEFLELAEIVDSLRPKAMLEIGTYRGGTLFVFSRLAAPNATVISLDLPASAMGKIYRLAIGVPRSINTSAAWYKKAAAAALGTQIRH